jgi:WD40 repeat protein
VLRDARTGAIVSARLYRPDVPVVSVAFNGDGSAIATGMDDGNVAVWRLTGGEHGVAGRKGRPP